MSKKNYVPPPCNGDIVTITLLNGSKKDCVYLDNYYYVNGISPFLGMGERLPNQETYQEKDIVTWSSFRPRHNL